jgi:hypothetical protein
MYVPRAIAERPAHYPAIDLDRGVVSHFLKERRQPCSRGQVSICPRIMTGTDGATERRQPPRRLLRYLPNVAAGIAEARGSDAPWAINRAVQELHSPLGQVGAHGIHAVDVDRELNAGSGRLGKAKSFEMRQHVAGHGEEPDRRPEWQDLGQGLRGDGRAGRDAPQR